MSDAFSLPFGDLFTLGNYAEAFEKVDILSAYRNSIIISGAVAVLVILMAGMASFALVRYRFRLNKTLYSLVIAAMMFPVFSTIIPVFRMEYGWGLAGSGNVWLSLISVILPQTAGNLAFAMVVLTGYMKGLPIELEEAAFMEGCNAYQIFFKVIMPLTKPSFATVGIFSFLWSYNDLFTQQFFPAQQRRMGDHKTSSGNLLQGGNELRPDGSCGDTGCGTAFDRLCVPCRNSIIKGMTARSKSKG